MDKNFKVNEAPAKEPVIFDHIFAEKVGGGLVKNAAYNRHPGLAVSEAGVCLKGAMLVEAITSESTSIKVKKDSGFAVNDVVASGAAAVKITAIDSSHADYDILTVTLGVALAKGAVIYEAAAAARAAGYEACESTDEGALKAVAADAGEGEILIASVTPWYGDGSAPSANTYVKAVPAITPSPKVAPAFVLGTFLPANCGDEMAKLVNGANIRKENALFPAEIAAQMKGIHLL